MIVWTEKGGKGYCGRCGAMVTVPRFGPSCGDYLLCGWCDFNARLFVGNEMSWLYIREGVVPHVR